jgi:hypothetical protein
LASLSDRSLSEKLELVHIQMEVAEVGKKADSLELLEIWRKQIIEARIYKAEHNVPDTPSEIELVIAELEEQLARGTERTKVLKSEATEVKKPEFPDGDPFAETREERIERTDQLSLF